MARWIKEYKIDLNIIPFTRNALTYNDIGSLKEWKRKLLETKRGIIY